MRRRDTIWMAIWRIDEFRCVPIRAKLIRAALEAL
jgi:hypothetical protein